MLSRFLLYIRALSFLTNTLQSFVCVDYCVLSFIECKLTLISFTKTTVNASVFFRKLIVIFYSLFSTINKIQINK